MMNGHIFQPVFFCEGAQFGGAPGAGERADEQMLENAAEAHTACSEPVEGS